MELKRISSWRLEDKIVTSKELADFFHSHAIQEIVQLVEDPEALPHVLNSEIFHHEMQALSQYGEGRLVGVVFNDNQLLDLAVTVCELAEALDSISTDYLDKLADAAEYVISEIG